MNKVNRFIDRFHNGKTVDEVFTSGCCYWFAAILHERFPESTIMYDPVYGHFMVEISKRLYDITGDVTDKYEAYPWKEDAEEYEYDHVKRDCVNF